MNHQPPAYVQRVRRFVLFHGRRHPAEMGEEQIVGFLTWLAVERKVSAFTQNQSLNAIVYLYRHVLKVDLGDLSSAVRAKKKRRLPTVLSKDEVRTILRDMDGVSGLVAQLIYGTGMRLLESLQLRTKDIDFGRHQILIREPKGGRDRVTLLPRSLIQPLRAQLARARVLHADWSRQARDLPHLPPLLCHPPSGERV